MPTDFERTFDDAVADYESVRPKYVPEIFDDILKYRPLDCDSSALEIGIGTGAATKPFLDTGCRLTAVEPGKNLAELAAHKYRGYGNLSIYTQSLQDYVCPDESFDLIYAATAFHWIPEEYGYKRVYGLLKPGGAFARFRYHAGPDKGRPDLADEIQEYYREYMRRERPAEFGDADAAKVAALAERYGLTDTRYMLFRSEKDFTADGYMALLRTYPDHMKLPEDDRNRLFDGIRRAIIKHGGVMTVYYTMDLELARKPLG